MTIRQDDEHPIAVGEDNEIAESSRLLHQVERFVAELASAPPATRPAAMLEKLERYEDLLEAYHAHFQRASLEELSLSYASEWILDNYYILRQATQQVREDLSTGYLRRLPKIDRFGLPGHPRVYFLARDFLEATALRVDEETLEDFIRRVVDGLRQAQPTSGTYPEPGRRVRAEQDSPGLGQAQPTTDQYPEPGRRVRAEQDSPGLGQAQPTTDQYPEPRRRVRAEQDSPGLRQAQPTTDQYPEPRRRVRAEQDSPGLRQAQPTLSMGELWALPIFLRFTLIESILYALRQIVRLQTDTGVEVAPFQMDVNCEEMVASAVVGLRDVSNLDWKVFFEAVNPVDQLLRQDPARVYDRLEFATRDRYRGAVEEIADRSGRAESDVAAAALEMAQRAAQGGDERSRHVGFWLVDAGREALESGLGIHAGVRGWARRRRGVLFVSSIVAIAALLLGLLALLLGGLGATPLQMLGGLALLLVPALTVSSGLVNWLMTLLLRPNMLPKLELEREIPPELHTLVIIPCFLSDPREVASLAQQLEQHYLRNPARGLHFALVSDFTDADAETQIGDQDLVDLAARLVDQLNERHRRADGDRPFYLLHRRRMWNASEGRWIGWERKRGKLNELNRLIMGEQDLSFARIVGDIGILQTVRYVITLDADTILPIGAANRLIGTLGHPLNQAVFEGDSGQVRQGYTILQPRVEISPRSANRSWFTRIYSGDVGLDLYSLAVSDVYQDLINEGIYVGKGIYDVRAFERSIHGQIGENQLLSHDLLEGLLGRAGLVTDITMVEDYPSNYFGFAQRAQRWIRGDWQLLPWLLYPRRAKGCLDLMDIWKIFDNLRRSLLTPALLALFLGGWMLLPGPAWLWTGLGMFTLAVPLFTNTARSLVSGVLRGGGARAVLHPAWVDLLRWLLALVFIPYEALRALSAIGVTLYRLLISHRQLLEWTTAAQTARTLRHEAPARTVLREMYLVLVLVVLAAVVIPLARPQSLAGAAPLLLAWLLAPLVGYLINRPARKVVERLSEAEEQTLRSYALRTWAFYEQFVGPEDHWLPPDHFQEKPMGLVAHRTSPTNIGMLLTSTLSAYEMGYVDQFTLVSRLSATFESLDRLERYRGHFINWIDTRSLQPLSPRYVSTVDSGNLAACLVLVSQSLQALSRAHIFRWQRWQGYLDMLGQMEEAVRSTEAALNSNAVEGLSQLLVDIRARVLAARYRTTEWYALFEQVRGPLWQQITGQLSAMVRSLEGTPSVGSLQRILQVSRQIDMHIKSIERTINDLVAWLPLLENPPSLLAGEDYASEIARLRNALPYSPAIGAIRQHISEAAGIVSDLQARLPQDASGQAAREWLTTLEQAMAHAAEQGSILFASYTRLARQSEQYISAMDFGFLYDPDRHVFHIGYNMDAARLDDNYYDLLASEARITSLIAIAKGDVPVEHWLHLNRPVTSLGEQRVLLSWSATLFEYLMPALFLRTYEGTLLQESAQGAVRWQIDYGRKQGVPWGISESGYYLFDANHNYQYRAFGVPGLGFKRGLADDLVIAPYASLMAVGFAPKQVMQNTAALAKLGALGQFGFYEALDFTEKRIPIGEEVGIVRSYMAHHQGMALLGIVNYLNDNVMLERMHADPQIRSVELLLQEQVPLTAPLQNPESESVSGTQRLIPPLVSVTPWVVPTQTSVPQVHLLANDNFTSLITNSGSGFLRWKDIDLTRWTPDEALDNLGTWIYLQELDGARRAGRLWTVTRQPVPPQATEPVVVYHAHMAVYRREENDIISTQEVTVSPEDPVEIRRVHLHNARAGRRRLRLTSYGEVILAAQAADARHPAFNKLFIQSEYVEGMNLLVFRRRPRSSSETPPFLGHMLVTAGGDALNGGFETDRMRFLGRGQDVARPRSLVTERRGPGAQGSTLDPVFSLAQEVRLEGHSSAVLAWVTFAASTREELMALAARYADWKQVERTFQQAHAVTENRLRRFEIDAGAVEQYSQLLSGLLFPLQQLRAAPEIIAANRLGQSGLWPFSISGDYPILLVEIEDPQRLELVREALRAQRFYRERGILVDLVILNAQRSNYGAEMNRLLYRLITRTGSDTWINQRGGVFVVYADQMKPDERVLLRSAARVLLDAERGTLADQLPGYSVPVPHLPAFTASRVAGEADETTPPLPEREELLFWNGSGGFTPDGNEYVIELADDAQTPLPWSNVIGYPEFGFLVTESGSSTTWGGNSGENRLTPWSNDPVSDPTGEALYLRDEETGAVWSPTPGPVRAGGTFRVRHGAGYTSFEHHAQGLRHRLRVFADPSAPVKIIHLLVENTWQRPRRITATQYVEWVLGTLPETTRPFLIPEYDDERAAMLATNPYSAEFGERVAFLAASKRVHGMTADRLEFIGRNGSLRAPAGLSRIGPEARVTPGEHPCAVLQLHLDLQPGGSEEIYFLLGQAGDRSEALALIDTFGSEERVAQSWQAVQDYWDALLNAVQVRTPDPAMDVLLNRWLLYQTLSCRIWGRTAFYQSSGAFGFRDQLQDVLATLAIAPGIAREQILRAAAHQFEQGDVLHWWHPPSGRGVRTRFSDDLLWLPYVVSEYVRVTGDREILDAEAPFLSGPELAPGEDEHYGHFELASATGSVFEHCRRAVERGTTQGVHGLPLMGSGDWNDGMNRVGIEGRGESVWLGWFLYDVLQRFADLCDLRGADAGAGQQRERARALQSALEAHAWDGAWYLRAFYDSGQPLGSRSSQECQIDSIAQSWAVISGAGDPQRARQAMNAVVEQLVRKEDGLILLFTPPFDQTPLDPGYIKGYVPGIRENGGQYTHGAIWTVWAFSLLGEGNRAGELFTLINPVEHAADAAGSAKYKVEPYVIAADVYGVDPHAGRGGWTWYTGSSGWYYRLGVEALLGLRREGARLRVNPTIPAAWDGFEITYRHKQGVCRIRVRNPGHVQQGVASVHVDGAEQADGWVTLEAGEQVVEVVLGEAHLFAGAAQQEQAG